MDPHGFSERGERRPGAPRRPHARRPTRSSERPGSSGAHVRPGSSVRPLGGQSGAGEAATPPRSAAQPGSERAARPERAAGSARVAGRGVRHRPAAAGQETPTRVWDRDAIRAEEQSAQLGSLGEPGWDGGTGAPERRRTSHGPGSRKHRLLRPARLTTTLMALVLVVVLGWGLGLTLWANSRIEQSMPCRTRKTRPGPRISSPVRTDAMAKRWPTTAPPAHAPTP